MNTLQFDPKTDQLTGPAGSLSIAPDDELARRFLMLVEGQCLEAQVGSVAQKYGCCRQRYYQILTAFKEGGLTALAPKKSGPKSNYRRTAQAERQILLHRFLDPDASLEVITQKLRQTHFSISLRSVERVIADYGVQKKTLQAQPQRSASALVGAKHPQDRAAGSRRPSQRRTGGSSTSG